MTDNNKSILNNENLKKVNGGVGGVGNGGAFLKVISMCQLLPAPQPETAGAGNLTLLPNWEVFTDEVTTDATLADGSVVNFIHVSYNGVWGWVESKHVAR